MAEQQDDVTMNYSDCGTEHEHQLNEEAFIRQELCPQLGDVVLDLGCGEGEAAAFMTQLVGPTGQVVGADPDSESIKNNQERFKSLTNLSFVEGSSHGFPGMGEVRYDLILVNYVLHLVDEKQQLFLDLFASLKPGGKIAMKYCHEVPELLQKSARELNPENYERIVKGVPIDSREKVSDYCKTAGFEIMKNQPYVHKFLFDNMQDVLDMFSTMPLSKDTFDVKLVTKERLNNFVPPIQDEKIVFAFPNVKLVAVKPAAKQ